VDKLRIIDFVLDKVPTSFLIVFDKNMSIASGNGRSELRSKRFNPSHELITIFKRMFSLERQQHGIISHRNSSTIMPLIDNVLAKRVEVFLLLVFFLTMPLMTTVTYAMSVDQHLITDDPKANTGCTTPTAKTTFTPTDSSAYSWVLGSGALPSGDSLTWNWYAPDNSLYASYPLAVNIAGSFCAYSWIDINGQATANKLGQWRVEIYNGITLAATDTFTISGPPPRYTFSADQQDLIENNGNPDYLIIAFNSTPQRREETWVYAKLKKMYVFWDGLRLQVKSAVFNRAAYSKPPALDPSLFTEDTKLPDLVQLLGGNYTSVDQPSLDKVIGMLNLKIYYFSDKGLYVAFLDDTLVSVQTIDIGFPERKLMINSIEKVFSKIMPSSVFAEKGSIITTGALPFTLALVIIACENSGYKPPKNLTEGFSSACEPAFHEGDSGELCILQELAILNDCKRFVKANGMKNAAGQGHAMNDADNACGTTDPAPACSPGKCKFAYSAWSDCKPSSEQTRTELSRSPKGCLGAPQLTQSCTFVPPPCVFTYNFNSCAESCWKTDAPNCCWPSNTCTRSVLSSGPGGCVGEPSLTLACTYQPPACTYTYDCKCQPSNTCTPTVSSAMPSGCTGTPDLTPRACTFCSDPSYPIQCLDVCWYPGVACCPGTNKAYRPGLDICCPDGMLCSVGQVCSVNPSGCCGINTPYPCNIGGVWKCCAIPQ
jgi:hypothetical protein